MDINHQVSNTAHTRNNILPEMDSFKHMEIFLAKTYFLISPSFDHYITGQLPYKRLFIVLLIKLGTIITFIRYGISALFDTPFLRWLTSNANYVLGNHLIISHNISLWCF